MPKSKQRKGHKQKVQARNKEMKAQATAMQKLFTVNFKPSSKEVNCIFSNKSPFSFVISGHRLFTLPIGELCVMILLLSSFI